MTAKLLLTVSSCLLALLEIQQGAEAFSAGSSSRPSVTSAVADSVNSSSDRRSFLDKALVASAAAITAATSVPGAASAVVGPATNPSNPLLGKKAPSFTLPNSIGDGSTTSLESLVKSKKWTVLYFFPGAFTQGCSLEAKLFQKDIDIYRKLNAQVVGVSVDAPEKTAEFCTKLGLDFYMLSDTSGEVSKAYGSAITVPGVGNVSNRQTFIIDQDGFFRHVFLDVEGRIPRHSAEVIEKLEEEEGRLI